MSKIIYCHIEILASRKNDGVVNRLLHIVSKIYRGLDDETEIAMVFLDISKAFDRVWHNILSSRNSSTFHKFIRRQLKRTEIIPTLIDANNVQIDDCDAKANLFNDFFCSTFTHDNNILPPFPSRVTAGATLLDNILFTPASVSTKLKGLTKSTTLNPDNFPPIVLQSCAHQLGLPLSIIFNTIFERSELPPAWLTSTVLPLFKKGERNQASNYRPISITSSCCKVMESIIHDSMSSYLLSNNLISDSQHGFLKKRSTLSNLIYSIRHWLSSLNSGKSTDVIYVDFAKAFDSVSHSKLLHKLISYGFSWKLHAWISTWLSGRTQTVKLGSSFSSPKSVLSGILHNGANSHISWGGKKILWRGGIFFCAVMPKTPYQHPL